LWGDFEPVKQLQVDGPMQIRLKSMGVRLKVKSKQPSMVHLRSTVPLVARIEGQDRDPQVIVSSNSMLDVWLPGHGEVALRVFGGGRFSGPLEITISDPQPIAEGLSDPVMVAPGETRVFSFEVTRAGEVGVGVRADADIVESVVLDERGRVLGSGVVQMLTLEPGRYLLALSVPKRARPVQLQPALVGVDAPSSGPPDEEIKKYLQFANEEAQP